MLRRLVPVPIKLVLILVGNDVHIASKSTKRGLLGGLKGFDVIYYSDVAGVTLKGKNMFVKKAAMKNAVMLQFKKKDQAQQALAIINGNKA